MRVRCANTRVVYKNFFRARAALRWDIMHSKATLTIVQTHVIMTQWGSSSFSDIACKRPR